MTVAAGFSPMQQWLTAVPDCRSCGSRARRLAGPGLAPALRGCALACDCRREPRDRAQTRSTSLACRALARHSREAASLADRRALNREDASAAACARRLAFSLDSDHAGTAAIAAPPTEVVAQTSRQSSSRRLVVSRLGLRRAGSAVVGTVGAVSGPHGGDLMAVELGEIVGLPLVTAFRSARRSCLGGEPV